MKYLMEEIRMRPDIKLLIYYDDLLHDNFATDEQHISLIYTVSF